MDIVRSKSELRALPLPELLKGTFLPVEWMALVADEDPFRVSYTCMNSNCPPEMLRLAVFGVKVNAGVLSSAASNVNAPEEVIRKAFSSREWPARNAALSSPNINWEELRDSGQRLPLSEKLILFGRKDAPEWMLRTVWALPTQMSLDGKDDINKTLRSIAERRLKKQGLLTPEELEEIEAREASK